MTTSGTASFNLDLNDIIEEAYERCGVEVRTGYEHRTARRSLNLLFADWANRGINLWTIEQGSFNLTQGVATYSLPVDTVDLLEHVIRTGAGNSATQADLTILFTGVCAVFKTLAAALPLKTFRFDFLPALYQG
jgi:hypothetical protein